MRSYFTYIGVSGKISTYFGYEAIYGSAAVLQTLAILYAMFFVKESHHVKKSKGESAVARASKACARLEYELLLAFFHF